jgi:hypothetical protein
MMINDTLHPFPTVSFGIERFWDTGATQWPDLERSKDVFEWTALDNQLAADFAHGVKVAFYTMSRTPSWGSSNPSDGRCNYGPGECDPPAYLAADGSGSDQVWRTWVQNIAQHVNDPTYLKGDPAKGQPPHAHISYWEPWNEVDRSSIIGNYGATADNISYEGTYAQLVRMTEDARCIILGEGTIHNYPRAGESTPCNAQYSGLPGAIDPTARIVMPSSHTESSESLEVASNFLYCNDSPKAGSECTTGNAGALAVDVINFHMKPGNESTVLPEKEITTMVTAGQALLETAEKAKPFWNGESGYGGNGWTGVYTDADMQASFVPRYFLLQWSLGVSSINWYTWDISNFMWTEAHGATLAAEAWQTTYDWMVGSRVTSACAVGAENSIWRCGLTLSNGVAAEAIWDSSKSCSDGVCKTSMVTVRNKWTTYRDLTGVTYTIPHPSSGVVQVPVGIKPILLEAGE